MNNKHYILIFILFCGLYGCKSWQIKNEIERLINREIQIPSNLETIHNGICQNSQTTTFECLTKLLIIYSPEDCTSCKISHLYSLENLFTLTDKALFSPIIVFVPEQKGYTPLLSLLNSNPFKYPVYVDKFRKIEQMNPMLPKDSRFHFLLLDKYNKVILIGDPTASDAMWSLFRKTLDNMLANDGLYVPE